MRIQQLIPLLVACLCITACSGVDFLNASIPRDGYHVTRDLAYGSEPRQKLDIYTPAAAHNAPTIVLLLWRQLADGPRRMITASLVKRSPQKVSLPSWRITAFTRKSITPIS